MLLVAISLPIATKLVSQNQENRSNAAIDSIYDLNPGGHEPECDKGETKCLDGFINTCNTSYRWTKTSQTCSDPKVTPDIPLCTTVRYGSWSDCVDGKQKRTVTKEPANCSGGVTVESSEKSCTIEPKTTTPVPVNPGGHEPECDKGETKCLDGFINTCNTSYRWTKTSQTCSDPKVTPDIPLCTTVRYGSWSDCVDGKQKRTVTKEPANCSGGVTVESSEKSCTIEPKTTTPVPVNPGGHEPECDKGETKCLDGFINTCNTSYRWTKTSQTCSDPKVTPDIPLCTTVRYGSWSDCVDGKQKRTVTKEPANCSGGVTVLPSEQTCVVKPTCTYFTTTYWGACNKFANGYFQTRTVKGFPVGCTGGTPPPTRQSCTLCDSSHCSTCGSPNECRLASCYWETQMRVCTSKPKENLPNPLCDGAMTGSKKCSNSTTLAKCAEKGWEFEYCNSWKSESCIDNKCQNINEYKKNFTSCTSSTFLGYKTYDNTSCPEGYSCDRELGVCKPTEKLVAKKAAGNSCNTDADCQSGYCDAPHGGSVFASAGKVCGDISDKEQIIEDAKIAAVELAVVATLTTGGVVLQAGGPTAAALMVTNWMAANPGIMSKIQTAGNVVDIAEYISGTIACAVNPNSILCQNLADDMAVPGMAGLADSAADVIDAGVDTIVAANGAKKAVDALVDTGEAVVDATDTLTDQFTYLYRVENPNIIGIPNGVTSDEALIGQWFTPVKTKPVGYLRKSQQTFGIDAVQVPGSRLVVVKIPNSDLEVYSAVNHPIASNMDFEPFEDYIVPFGVPRATLGLDGLQTGLGNAKNLTIAQQQLLETMNSFEENVSAQTYSIIDPREPLLRRMGMTTENLEVAEGISFDSLRKTLVEYPEVEYLDEGARAIAVVDKKGGNLIKISRYVNDPNNLSQIATYQNNAALLGYRGVIGDNQAFVQEFIPNTKQLMEYSPGKTFTQQEIDDAVAQLKELQNATGVPHGDIASAGVINRHNVLVQEGPNGEKKIKIIDYAGQDTEMIESLSEEELALYMQRELENFRKGLEKYLIKED